MLEKTRLVIDECGEHLNSTGCMGSSIESYLTQHILVVLAADVQQALYDCIDSIGNQSKDDRVKAYLTNTRRNVIRDVSKDSIANLVKQFGTKQKSCFDKRLNGRDREITAYGNALDKRHKVAHTHGATVTFREIEKAYAAAIIILSALTEALSLDDPGQRVEVQKPEVSTEPDSEPKNAVSLPTARGL